MDIEKYIKIRRLISERIGSVDLSSVAAILYTAEIIEDKLSDLNTLVKRFVDYKTL